MSNAYDLHERLPSVQIYFMCRNFLLEMHWHLKVNCVNVPSTIYLTFSTRDYLRFKSIMHLKKLNFSPIYFAFTWNINYKSTYKLL